MWTVIEQPYVSTMPSINGTLVRHLLEDGEQQTACGLPVSDGAREVSVSWRRATDRCPACDQEQGVG